MVFHLPAGNSVEITNLLSHTNANKHVCTVFHYLRKFAWLEATDSSGLDLRVCSAILWAGIDIPKR